MGSSVGPRGAELRRRRGPVRWRGGRERPATGQLYPSERGACGQAPSCQRHSRTRRAKPPFGGTLCGLGVDDRRRRARLAACVLAGLLLATLAGSLPPQPAAADGERLLVFTKTLGYRHDSISAAVAAIRGLAARHGVEVDLPHGGPDPLGCKDFFPLPL